METGSAPNEPSSESSPPKNPQHSKLTEKSPNLPFSGWWPVIVGALVGIALRLIFSAKPGYPYATMGSAFILLAPLAVGAITVYLAETKARRSWGYYITAPIIANLLFISGTLAILIEGLICAIVIVPVFLGFGVIGGLIMGVVCRKTNWPKHTVASFAILPLILGAFPPNEIPEHRVISTERTIMVETNAQQVWQQLHNVRDIQPQEVERAWMYRIGVPLPLTGVTQTTATGLVRKITMGKSIHFDQISTDWEENRYVKWRYQFTDDSFPARALDDHVKIGGHYFDILDTEYILTPRSAQATELTIRMHYRVSTQFNWYANSVARFLIGNFEEVILDFYRQRSIAATI